MGLIEETASAVSPPDRRVYEKALRRCDTLTKPPGSLGVLEETAARIAAITGRDRPRAQKKAVAVFAADHGVAQEGVSAFPKEVTRQMVNNFLSGGAAVNVLARLVGADVFIVDAGVDFDFPSGGGVISRKTAKGTRNFAKRAAMTREQAVGSVEAGIETAFEIADGGYQIAAPGDMGIGNTTSAAAVICASYGVSPKDITGAGTGLGPAGVREKTGVVSRALEKHFPGFPDVPRPDALEILRKVGGFEIGAAAGMMVGLAARRIPVVADGFVIASAVCLAVSLCPAVAEYLFFSHKSSEKGHAKTLRLLGKTAPMDLGMRLGEGTGALIMFPVIDAALALFNRMATFESAGVSRAPR